MKTLNNYTSAKAQLKSISLDAKRDFKNDKPAIRQCINDYADSLCKDLNLSHYQRELLSNYACTLHPKK